MLETMLVSLQAWRGVPSHFNLETTFDGSVARMLAAGGFVLVMIIGTLLIVAFRRDPTTPISLRIAVRFGFVLLFTSMVVGGLMIAKGMTLVFGGDPHTAYATGGTLKPTHAATMHAILVLPLLAWLLSFAEWPEGRRVIVVVLASAGYVLCAAVVAVENIMLVEFSEMSPAAEMLFTLGASAFLAAGVLTVIGATRGSAAHGLEHR